MESEFYSTSRDCYSTLCYQLIILDHLDCDSLVKVITFIGNEDEDVFAILLDELIKRISTATGEEITEEMYEHYESLYNTNKDIIVDGYKYVIVCDNAKFKDL